MSDTQPQKINPRETALSAPYWEGCRVGELRLQQCGDCQQFQFYPRINCSHCAGSDLRWTAVSGRGEIASFTVVRRGISRAYEAPYVVALVRLAEGPTMMSAIVGAEPEQVSVGQGVSLDFEERPDALRLPVFRLFQGDSP